MRKDLEKQELSIPVIVMRCSKSGGVLMSEEKSFDAAQVAQFEYSGIAHALEDEPTIGTLHDDESGETYTLGLFASIDLE
jgi:hypothetical protein